MNPIPPSPRPTAWLLLAVAILCGCVATRDTRPVAQPAADQGRAAPTPGWKSIGLSVEGRQLLVAESGSGPLRIYLVGGIHGDETEGRSALEAMKDQSFVGATIRMVRDLNPDGTAASRRVNARNYDLNRNWPAMNFEPGSTGGDAPLSEPETRALHQDLRAFQPQLVIVLHSTPTGPLVNYDGPAAEFASAFTRAAQAYGSGWHVQPDMGYPTPGSLGSWLGVDQKVPILTIEFDRGQDEASAAAALRQGLSATIRAAGAPGR